MKLFQRICSVFMCFGLAVSLVACASGSTAPASAYAGTWKLTSLVDHGVEMSSSNIELLESIGMYIYLDVNDDGTCVYSLYGEPFEGTWGQTDDATTLAVPDLDLEVTLDVSGSQLTARDKDESEMAFVRIKASDKVESDIAVTTKDSGTLSERLFGVDEGEPVTDVEIVDDESGEIGEVVNDKLVVGD